MIRIYLDQSKVRPEIGLVDKGSNLRIFCDSNAQEVTWFRNDKDPLPSNANPEVLLKALHFEKVELSNRGYYTCKGKDKNGETFYGRVTVKVRGTILAFVCVFGMNDKNHATLL